MGKYLLNILACVSALLAIYFMAASNQILYNILKPLTTIIIVMVPLLYGKRYNIKYLYCVIGALVFCLIGDILLLDDAYFIFGLGTFLVAHILFLYGFITLGGFKKYWISLALLLVIGGTYYYILYKELGDLFMVVVLYILIILLMAWQGISLYLWQRKKVFFTVSIAVILFLISDATLAFDKFKESFDLSGILVLSTYWASILLLANSTLYISKTD